MALAGPAAVTHWSPWVFVTASALTVAFLLVDRILKPWRARRQAEAEERKVVALVTSDEMRAAFQVLTGTPANPTQGIAEVPGVGKRLARLESELKPNGGDSARDLLDRIHAVAVENAEANARVEQAQREAAGLAGTAATLAANADQRVQELAEQSKHQHEDNVRRLAALESAAYEERMRRELYLYVLKDKYEIDLDPEEG